MLPLHVQEVLDQWNCRNNLIWLFHFFRHRKSHLAATIRYSPISLSLVFWVMCTALKMVQLQGDVWLLFVLIKKEPDPGFPDASM